MGSRRRRLLVMLRAGLVGSKDLRIASRQTVKSTDALRRVRVVRGSQPKADVKLRSSEDLQVIGTNSKKLVISTKLLPMRSSAGNRAYRIGHAFLNHFESIT